MTKRLADLEQRATLGDPDFVFFRYDIDDAGDPVSFYLINTRRTVTPEEFWELVDSMTNTVFTPLQPTHELYRVEAEAFTKLRNLLMPSLSELLAQNVIPVGAYKDPAYAEQLEAMWAASEKQADEEAQQQENEAAAPARAERLTDEPESEWSELRSMVDLFGTWDAVVDLSDPEMLKLVTLAAAHVRRNYNDAQEEYHQEMLARRARHSTS